jgi:hypothetical protein
LSHAFNHSLLLRSLSPTFVHWPWSHYNSTYRQVCTVRVWY